MIIFNHCHSSSPREDADKDDVVSAISFLAKCAGRRAFAHSHQVLSALSDAGGLLQSLLQAIDVRPHAIVPPTRGNTLNDSVLSTGERSMGEEIQMETPGSMFSMGVDEPSLGGLDQLDSLDWILDFNPELQPISG